LQNPQSPTIGSALSLQSFKVHVIRFLGGIPPRTDAATWTVLSRVMLFERSVEEGERCRPACTRRSESVGVDVRSDTRCVRLDTVVLDGTVIGIVSPDKFLTKICIDSGWRSGEADRDEEVLEGVDILGTVRCI